VVVGLIPFVGQAADLRDTIAAFRQVQNGEKGAWVNLFAAGVGWVPGIGDAAKGLIRGGKRTLDAGTEVAQGVARRAGEVVGDVAKGGTGKLVGSIDNLTAVEQSFVREMVAGGKTVEIIPTATGRTADFFINGTRYELKTMSNVVNQTSDGLSKALSSTIMNARGQSGNIIIDARGQAGMTPEIAGRGIIRALNRDAEVGSKIQNVTVITPQGTVYIPRLLK